MVGTCRRVSESEIVNYTHSAAVVVETPINVTDLGVLIPIASAVISTPASYYRNGIFQFTVANSIAIAVGDFVYYNSTAGTVVLVKPTAGFLLGTAMTAGTGNSTGTVSIEVDVNNYNSGSGQFQGLDLACKTITPYKAVAAIADSAITLTAAQVKGGIVTQTPTAGRAVTMPAAADLLALLPGTIVGSAIELTIKNLAASTHAITVTASDSITNGGVAGDFTIAASGTATFLIVFSNVTASAEAAVMYLK